MGNFAARAVQNTFVASRLVSMVKARFKQDDLSVFDWDLTDRGQGNFDTKMMAFMSFKEGVTPAVRKRVQLDLK